MPNTYNICECLGGLVAWRDLCVDDSACVHYLNDLPPLDNLAMKNMLSQETPTVEKAFARLEKEAIRSLYNVFLQAANGKIRRSGRNYSNTSGKYEQPFNPMGLSSNYRGLLINVNYSQYLEVQVQAIRLRATNTANSSIYIYDADTGELLSTTAVAAVANTTVRVAIQDSYFATRLFIVYDASELNLIETESFISNVGLIRCGCSEGAYQIPKATSPVIYDNLQSAVSIGMIVEYTVRCSPERWLCRYKDLSVNALLYQMGLTFLQGTYMSDMLNHVTLATDDRATLTDMWIASRDTAIEQVLEAVDEADYCFECDDTVKRQWVLP